MDCNRAHGGALVPYYKSNQYVGVSMVETVARYHRVSTDNQDPERQVQATKKYVGERFGEVHTVEYADISTGTNTQRDDYQQLMSDVDAGEIDAVVVKSVSRIARSVRDLDRTVERLREGGSELHIINESLSISPDDSDPFQRAMWQLLGVFAELESEMTRQRIKEGIAARRARDDYHHGPPPLGFDKEDGSLRESPQYDRVCTVLSMVDDGEMSQRQAAKELNCGRKTVRRALKERRDLYGL